MNYFLSIELVNLEPLYGLATSVIWSLLLLDMSRIGTEQMHQRGTYPPQDLTALWVVRTLFIVVGKVLVSLL